MRRSRLHHHDDDDDGDDDDDEQTIRTSLLGLKVVK